ncbi:heme biosynthesis protein HemY [Phreatobacter sp.]|uniref:heme biosynthesis protein HemY n=1 Tax=Phreatobacter sp. TaxID=1966341 RepID=UPI003F6FB7FC
MIRIVVFLLLIAALATGAGWLADRPGTVTVVWLGRNIEFEVLTGIVAVVVAAALAMLSLSLLRWLVTSPAIAARAMRRRKQDKGREAIQRGIVAVGAGDRRAAERHASEADRYAPDAPLTLLLKAQAAQLAGDRPGAEKAFRAMIDRPDTRVLGLRGLHVEAQRRADPVAARAIAEEAVKVAPGAGWAAQAVLESQTVSGDWDGAIATVEKQYAARVIDKDTAKRRRAVLVTAKAAALEDVDPPKARALALEAVTLAPTLTPAAAIAGRLLAHENDPRKASKIIEAAWKAMPHPDLAEAYAHARQGDSRLDQLKRVEYLARLTPSHPEALLAVARAAIDAGDYATAHRALDEVVEIRPTQRVCLLMAELFTREASDYGRAREWMARALRAPRDPVWTADGQASDVWLPASPVTGRLDAFEWKVPVAELGGPSLHVDDVLADIAEAEAQMAAEAVAPAPVIELVPEPAPEPIRVVEPEPAPPPSPPPVVVPVAAAAASIVPTPPAAPPPPAAAPLKANGTAAPEPAPAPSVEPDPVPAVATEPVPAATEPVAEPAPAPAAADPAPEATGPARTRPKPVETVFPMARAPDDPGPPEPAEAPPKRMSIFRS